MCLVLVGLILHQTGVVGQEDELLKKNIPLIIVLLIVYQWLRWLREQQLLLLLLPLQHLFAEHAIAEAVNVVLLFVREAARGLWNTILRWYVIKV